MRLGYGLLGLWLLSACGGAWQKGSALYGADEYELRLSQVSEGSEKYRFEACLSSGEESCVSAFTLESGQDFVLGAEEVVPAKPSVKSWENYRAQLATKKVPGTVDVALGATVVGSLKISQEAIKEAAGKAASVAYWDSWDHSYTTFTLEQIEEKVRHNEELLRKHGLDQYQNTPYPKQKKIDYYGRGDLIVTDDFVEFLGKKYAEFLGEEITPRQAFEQAEHYLKNLAYKSSDQDLIAAVVQDFFDQGHGADEIIDSRFKGAFMEFMRIEGALNELREVTVYDDLSEALLKDPHYVLRKADDFAVFSGVPPTLKEKLSVISGGKRALEVGESVVGELSQLNRAVDQAAAEAYTQRKYSQFSSYEQSLTLEEIQSKAQAAGDRLKAVGLDHYIEVPLPQIRSLNYGKGDRIITREFFEFLARKHFNTSLKDLRKLKPGLGKNIPRIETMLPEHILASDLKQVMAEAVKEFLEQGHGVDDLIDPRYGDALLEYMRVEHILMNEYVRVEGLLVKGNLPYDDLTEALLKDAWDTLRSADEFVLFQGVPPELKVMVDEVVGVKRALKAAQGVMVQKAKNMSRASPLKFLNFVKNKKALAAVLFALAMGAVVGDGEAKVVSDDEVSQALRFYRKALQDLEDSQASFKEVLMALGRDLKAQGVALVCLPQTSSEGIMPHCQGLSSIP